MKIKTLIELAKEGRNWRNAPNILRGVINHELDNFGFMSETRKQIIEDRLATCGDCPYANTNIGTDALPESSKERTDFHCTLCGCTLKYKTASFGEECPVKKWRSWTEEEIEKLELENEKQKNG